MGGGAWGCTSQWLPQQRDRICAVLDVQSYCVHDRLRCRQSARLIGTDPHHGDDEDVK